MSTQTITIQKITRASAETTTMSTQQEQNKLHRFHEHAGDAGNLFFLVISIVYIMTVTYFTLPGAPNGFVDEHWKKDGFCIQNMDVPYWSSFDTCLYIDVVFSAVLGVMYLSWKSIPGMETSSAIIPGTILATVGHGIVHGATAFTFRDGSYHEQQQEEEEIPREVELVPMVLLFAVLWCPLLNAAMPKLDKKKVLLCAAIATYGQLYVKKELGFGYVQTLVNVGFHASQLMLSSDDKNKREYMLQPLIGLFPMIVGWNEALYCDSFLRSMGGHALYDASIILSCIVFYLDCYSNSGGKSLSSSTNGLSAKDKTI